NDSAGHAAGDGLIVRAAQALREAARGIDVVARLGGDEFGILAIECDEGGAKALLVRVREALAARQVGASVGAAVRLPALSMMAAWQAADQQMYEHKRAHQRPNGNAAP
ncbi:MAG: GGDEF domain-containing protein, partial [Rubrivivax sp.]|nr:GGDEF domain-containing protein [Rubrivivax sp.]